MPHTLGGPPGGHLLTGEESGLGPPAWDIGWLLGELVELEAAAGHPGSGVADVAYPELRRHVLASYGPGRLDAAEVGRYAAVRLLLHAHDFAAYVGTAAPLAGYLALLPPLVDAALAGSLATAPVVASHDQPD